ncbi:MAG: peptidase Ste24p [Gemmatimonadetes bacterium]|nr:peptidase Ste24p [Gemmatimonadota bacterium]
MTRSRYLLLLIALGSCSVSQDQEVQMGASTAQQVESEMPLVDDAIVNDFVTALGQRIAATTTRSDLQWRFRVVNSDQVNAFALPGGFIYVNRGLIERAERMDELAGTLGHEIGHVVRRHSVQQMEKATKANIGVSLLCTLTSVCNSTVARVGINVAGNAWFAKHSRLDEAQADSEAVVNVVQAGIDPRGVPELFEVLLRERKTQPGLLDGFFASHPLEESRVQATRDEIAQLDLSRAGSLAADSPDFQAMRARLKSLPPPPAPRAIPQQLMDSVTPPAQP